MDDGKKLEVWKLKVKSVSCDGDDMESRRKKLPPSTCVELKNEEVGLYLACKISTVPDQVSPVTSKFSKAGTLRLELSHATIECNGSLTSSGPPALVVMMKAICPLSTGNARLLDLTAIL